MQEKPWVTGPVELLRSGLEQYRVDSDISRRIAMILIDNAVEIMFKTFFALEKSENGLALTAKDRESLSANFHTLLEGLQRLAPDKLLGVDPVAIRYYHRIRNNLYHEWDGTTPERSKVQGYSEAARKLLVNLFGEAVGEMPPVAQEAIQKFEAAWGDLQRELELLNKKFKFSDKEFLTPLHWIEHAAELPYLSPTFAGDFDGVFRFRNRLAEGVTPISDEVQENLFLIKALIREVSQARRSP